MTHVNPPISVVCLTPHHTVHGHHGGATQVRVVTEGIDRAVPAWGRGRAQSFVTSVASAFCAARTAEAARTKRASLPARRAAASALRSLAVRLSAAARGWADVVCASSPLAARAAREYAFASSAAAFSWACGVWALASAMPSRTCTGASAETIVFSCAFAAFSRFTFAAWALA